MAWLLPGFLLPVPYPGDSRGKLKYYCMAGNFDRKIFGGLLKVSHLMEFTLAVDNGKLHVYG